MNRIKKLETSTYNHGTHPEIFCTVVTEHEIRLDPLHMILLLRNLASDDMAKIINVMAAEWNKWEQDEAAMVADLNDEGKKLIDNLHYFIHGEQ